MSQFSPPPSGSVSITNAHVPAGANIAESKLALAFPTHTNANDPSTGEKAGLAGTSGAPGGGNKYVTNADARNSNARTPVAHDNTKHSETYVILGGTFVIENRTNDPSTPATGRLWFRTDL